MRIYGAVFRTEVESTNVLCLGDSIDHGLGNGVPISDTNAVIAGLVRIWLYGN